MAYFKSVKTLWDAKFSDHLCKYLGSFEHTFTSDLADFTRTSHAQRQSVKSQAVTDSCDSSSI